MVFSKKDEFTKDQIWLAEVAKALSHPARIKILKILSDLDSCIVGSIVDLLPLSQSTVSQHLKELKKVGLIIGEFDGPKVCYCINDEVLTKVKSALDKLFSEIGCC